MIRESVSCLIYLFCIVGFSGAIDEGKKIKECEDKAPHDIYFDLSNMGLNSIRKSFVSGPSVTCVNLAKNQILKLENGAFDGLPELTYLNLAENPVSFEDFMQMNLPKLTTLVLDGPFSEQNEVHNPSSNYYHPNQYYGRVEPRINNISPIILPNLKKISARNFEIQEHQSRYSGDQGLSTWLEYIDVSNLTHLYLGGNNFVDGNLPEKFKSTLTHLNIDNNQVKMFMTNFPELQYLSMDNNKIENLCNGYCNGYSLSLRDLPNLKYLSLVSNEISTIESDAFEDSINLRVLNLTGNKIEHLPRHLFDNMTSLKSLILSNNKLTEISDICGLRELEVLVLDGNKILNIDQSNFCNLPNLNYIGLSHNNLTTIWDGTFGQLSGLVKLDLSWNQIEVLPLLWAGSDSNLNVLNLDGNLFIDVANMSLGLVEKLDKLSIGQNPLKMVTVRSLMTLPENMTIDVSRVYP